jgi:hypothetical protein
VRAATAASFFECDTNLLGILLNTKPDAGSARSCLSRCANPA